jgi:hypothetical protein
MPASRQVFTRRLFCSSPNFVSHRLCIESFEKTLAVRSFAALSRLRFPGETMLTLRLYPSDERSISSALPVLIGRCAAECSRSAVGISLRKTSPLNSYVLVPEDLHVFPA